MDAKEAREIALNAVSQPDSDVAIALAAVRKLIKQYAESGAMSFRFYDDGGQCLSGGQCKTLQTILTKDGFMVLAPFDPGNDSNSSFLISWNLDWMN